MAKKLKKDELEKLVEFQNQIKLGTEQIGDIQHNIYKLDMEARSISAKIDETVKNRGEYLEKLRETYGDGSIDLDSGQFNPSEK